MLLDPTCHDSCTGPFIIYTAPTQNYLGAVNTLGSDDELSHANSGALLRRITLLCFTNQEHLLEEESTLPYCLAVSLTSIGMYASFLLAQCLHLIGLVRNEESQSRTDPDKG